MFNSYKGTFTPGFLDLLIKNDTFKNSDLYKNALANCGGVSSCISDSILTGKVSFGVLTKNTLTDQIKSNALSCNFN